MRRTRRGLLALATIACLAVPPVVRTVLTPGVAFASCGGPTNVTGNTQIGGNPANTYGTLNNCSSATYAQGWTTVVAPPSGTTFQACIYTSGGGPSNCSGTLTYPSNSGPAQAPGVVWTPGSNYGKGLYNGQGAFTASF